MSTTGDILDSQEHYINPWPQTHTIWQKCPVCDGQGIVSKPPYIAGDVNKWVDITAVHTCHACNGAGIIPCTNNVKEVIKYANTT